METLQVRWEADEAACWAHRRVHVYRLLSAGFGPPTPTSFLRHLVTTGEFLGYLRQALAVAPTFDKPLAEFSRCFQDRDMVREVEAEHCRLFPRLVSPRGSDHGGPSPRKVRAFYRNADLALVASPLPADHIAVETAFAAALTEREMWLRRRGCLEEAEEASEHARKFLAGYLAPWAPRFALRVEAESASPFYGALARVLAEWVVLEAEMDFTGLQSPGARSGTSVTPAP